MSRLRDTVVVTISTIDHHLIDLSATPRRTRADARVQSVRVVVINRRALDVALQLAGGDPRRLRFEAATGSVVVANLPR